MGPQVLMEEMTPQPPGRRVHGARGSVRTQAQNRGQETQDEWRLDIFLRELLQRISSRNQLLLVHFKTAQRPIINKFVGLFLANALTNKSRSELLPFWLLIRSRDFPWGEAGSPEVTVLCCCWGGVPQLYFSYGYTNRNKKGLLGVMTEDSR